MYWHWDRFPLPGFSRSGKVNPYIQKGENFHKTLGHLPGLKPAVLVLGIVESLNIVQPFKQFGCWCRPLTGLWKYFRRCEIWPVCFLYMWCMHSCGCTMENVLSRKAYKVCIARISLLTYCGLSPQYAVVRHWMLGRFCMKLIASWSVIFQPLCQSYSFVLYPKSILLSFLRSMLIYMILNWLMQSLWIWVKISMNFDLWLEVVIWFICIFNAK